MPDEYISREAALTALQDSDLFNTTNGNCGPFVNCPPQTLRRWCMERR